MRRMLFGAAFLLAGLPSLAADLAAARAPDGPASANACADSPGAPPDAFGFAAGSDVAAPGDLGAGLEYSGAWGVRAGSSQAHGLKASLSMGLAPCVELGPSLSYGWSRAVDPSGARTTTNVVGAGFEAKYKLLNRATHGFGLTVSFEPTAAWSRARLVDPAAPPVRAGSSGLYGATAKILVDAELAKDRLYGAFNIEQSAAFQRDNGVDCAIAGGGWCKSSFLNLRAALALKVAETFYLGVDLAHQRAYDGAFLNRAPGWAWFAGPNLFWQANEKVSFNAAWAVQLSGKAPGQTAGSLNLDQFTRHAVKAKLGVSF